MKLMSLVMILASLALVGCSTTTKKSQSTGNMDVRVTSDLNADLDIDMSKKIQGVATHKVLFGFIPLKASKNYAEGVVYDGGESSFLGGDVEAVKSAAAFNAVVPAKADVLVAPQYVIRVESTLFGLYKKVTAQVSGYGARIRNIRQKR